MLNTQREVFCIQFVGGAFNALHRYYEISNKKTHVELSEPDNSLCFCNYPSEYIQIDQNVSKKYVCVRPQYKKGDE